MRFARFLWLPALWPAAGLLYADGVASMTSGVYTPPAATTATTTLSSASATVEDMASTFDIWPRQFLGDDGTVYTVYQPQLDSWDGFKLKGRAAVSVLPKEAKTAIYGIIAVEAQTLTDRQARTADIDKITIAGIDFPSEKTAAVATWSEQLRSHVRKNIKNISLDRLEASLAAAQTHSPAKEALKNDAPHIIFSTKPALLVLVDGTPQWRKVDGSSLERALNTRALLLKDTANDDRLLLHFWNGYLEASSIKGPWKVAAKISPEILAVENMLVGAKQVDLLSGQPNPDTGARPALESQKLPEIYVATTPTELLTTAGEPHWTPISGTQLLYASNTGGHIFKDIGDQKLYVLISGRWFSASDFAGTWKYVAGTSLPIDFQKIPDDSPQENVKAAVPGTAQAQEALIANSIPQTTKLNRAETKLATPIVYDGGSPVLTAVTGTPLFYAMNTTTPVIKVDDKTWFACQNGAWFTATSANGPWALATSVPAVVYSIPATSPIYFVTYVRVYAYDPTFVWVGYTPGYYGAIVSADGTVVYGTGYAYTPYVGTTVYVSYPVTYGYAAAPTWTPWAGWAMGFAVGFAWGSDWSYWSYCPPAPYWGPYHSYCYGWGYNSHGGITAWGPYGWAGTSGDIYHTNGPWSSVSRVAGGYDGWTGNQWATQYGHAYNSTTGTRIAGQRGAIENVYTGNYAYGGRGVAHNDATGITAAGRRTTIGNEDTGRQITGGHGTIYNPNTGTATHIAGAHGNEGNSVLAVNGNVYAGHDGHVYQRNGDGSWNQLTRQSAPGNLGTGSATLEREHSAREFGGSRAEGFRSSHPAFAAHGGGGRGGFRR